MPKELSDFLTEKSNILMLKQIFDFPVLLKKGIEDAKNIPELDTREISSQNVAVYWYGMGASGLIGEYIKYYMQYGKFKDSKFKLNINVRHSEKFEYHDNAFYVFYSYSGNTFETVMALDSAIKHIPKDNIIVFSTGGKMLKKAQDEGITHISLIEGYVSRSHLPYGIALCSTVFSKIFGCDVGIDELKKTANELENLIHKLSTSIDLGKEFNLIAKKLGKKIAIIVADYQLVPVAKRFMAQLNENSKHFASFFEVPEGCHNFIVGLRSSMKKAFFIVIRRDSEDNFIRNMLDTVESNLTKADTIRIKSRDNGIFCWRTLLEPTVWIDILSVFLADIKGESAFDIREITAIKEKLLSLRDEL